MAKPGWYEDPAGDRSKLRFWDGARWTDHLKARPGSPPTPTSGSDQSQSSPHPVPSQRSHGPAPAHGSHHHDLSQTSHVPGSSQSSHVTGSSQTSHVSGSSQSSHVPNPFGQPPSATRHPQAAPQPATQNPGRPADPQPPHSPHPAAPTPTPTPPSAITPAAAQRPAPTPPPAEDPQQSMFAALGTDGRRVLDVPDPTSAEPAAQLGFSPDHHGPGPADGYQALGIYGGSVPPPPRPAQTAPPQPLSPLSRVKAAVPDVPERIRNLPRRTLLGAAAAVVAALALLVTQCGPTETVTTPSSLLVAYGLESTHFECVDSTADPEPIEGDPAPPLRWNELPANDQLGTALYAAVTCDSVDVAAAAVVPHVQLGDDTPPELATCLTQAVVTQMRSGDLGAMVSTDPAEHLPVELAAAAAPAVDSCVDVASVIASDLQARGVAPETAACVAPQVWASAGGTAAWLAGGTPDATAVSEAAAAVCPGLPEPPAP